MDTIAPMWLWSVFVVTVLVALFLDFVVLKKQGAHAVGVREAAWWSLVWVGVSLAFNGLLWWAVQRQHGSALANEKSLEFLTGYLIEKSLAVDNIFVFLMIFTYFAVPPAYQKRVLMSGIIGAIVLRTVMMLGGRLLRRWIPVSERFDGEKFFTRIRGRRIATPLLLVVVLVGVIDVIFAVDSI